MDVTTLRKLIADTAREVSTADLVPVVLDDETAEKIAVAVLAHAGMGYTTEWGARFPSGNLNVFTNEHDAEVEAVSYGGELVSRRVGPWTAVQS